MDSLFQIVDDVSTGIYNLEIGCALCAIGFPTLFFCYRYYIVRAVMCGDNNRLDNKTVLITGATSGIGEQVALELARRGAHLLLACKDVSKGEKVKNEILQEVPSCTITIYEVNLSSLSSVRALVNNIKSNEHSVNMLINNAGIGGSPSYQETMDGLEMTFCINYLAPFLLTLLLLELLLQSPDSRVINVSAHTHVFGSIHKDDLLLSSPGAYSAFKAYAQSKLALILFTRELASQYQDESISIHAVHPGVTNTLMRFQNSMLKKWILKWFTKSPLEGAQTIIWCAVNKDLDQVTGKYYSNCAEATPIVPAFNDLTSQLLWEDSERLCGIKSVDSLD